MASKALDVRSLVDPHSLAEDIANKWHEWDMKRASWKEQSKELRNYLYATDTTTTSNAKLPWSNSTTTPKLTQIYDNLKANYSAALFPNSNWLRWESNTEEDAVKEKRDVIEAYMKTKLAQSKFETEVDRLLDDFIIYGNCFGYVTYVNDTYETMDGVASRYIGPKLTRISPYDIVFNPVSASFEQSPKILRHIVTLAELDEIAPGYLEKVITNRSEVSASKSTEKSDGFIADGFGTIEDYYGSGYVEVLVYYGDIYDAEANEAKKNRRIVVIDRAYVVEDSPVDSWLGSPPIFHVGWRSRPDNLWAMGPLDNLVGMQYRIDHLENLKADIFDQIALPILKIRGDVQSFSYEPGARILVGDDGDVTHLVPDSTALNADFQIQNLENKMEELAGAPRQAMGIRTPGEKTAFEVQALENAGSRIFQHKASKYEREFIEPILNAMLEAARRLMNTADVVKVLDESTGATIFRQVTKEVIQSNGVIVPKGARHFAERAQRVQNLQNLQMVRQDPSVGVHLSGKRTAELFAEELGEDNLYAENIGIQEQLETQKAMQDAEASNIEQLQGKAELGI